MNHFKFQLLIQLFCFVFSLSAEVYEIPKDTSYTSYQTYIKIRKKFPDIKLVEPINSSQLECIEQVVYTEIKIKNVSRKLHLDVFRPNDNKIYPALIMIHGGGWRSGNKSMEKPMAQRTALKGYVTIPVEYRLSLEAKCPAAVNDIKAAIRWVKVNAKEYGIDTSKIAIEGESAGGQLAALVAMTDCYSTIKALIDVDGVVDFLAPNSLNSPQKPDSPGSFWLGGTFEENPLNWKNASAIYYVNKKSPPVLFITSAQPRFHAGRDEMIDLLNQNGVYSESYSIPDTPHSFWLFDPWFDPTKNYITTFLQKILKPI